MRRESAAVDLLWIALAVLVFVAAGIGLRDPWPADEPRFALLGRDMAASSDWLFPRVGGDLYQDKPPLHFWLLACAYALTGSVRASFLLPSLLATFGTLALVYDFARRTHGRAAGLAAALLLLCTLQFLLSARSAQIDATLCFLTTLSLYGLLRHVLHGPDWGWYFVAGLAAGLGVITKGVGFLPLLALLPYAFLRARGFEPLPRFNGGARWALATLGLAIGILVWLAPMLFAAAGRADLAAYRDEILFQQTVQRYTRAWHHTKPWYYFALKGIPLLWLPVSVLLVWLVPRWRDAWRTRDARAWLPLAWALLVLVFFSLSAGKRGVYVLPALPAIVLAAAPYLDELVTRRNVQRASLALAAALIALALLAIAGWVADLAIVKEAGREVGLRSIVPFAGFVGAGILAWGIAWRTRAALAWPAVLAVLALTWGIAIAPAINGQRSARSFMARVLARVEPGETLGFVDYREQFLLYTDRQTVNFGHRRWIEGDQEANDAASWLAAGSRRVLLAPAKVLQRCFARANHEKAGRTSREEWFLVRGAVDVACVEKGDPTRAITYRGGNAQKSQSLSLFSSRRMPESPRN